MRERLESLRREVGRCRKCPLWQGRTQTVFGVGRVPADLMLVGEAPGFHEDRMGEPFVGAAGQLLTRLLAEAGLPRTEVYIANVLKCRPPGNRDPLPEEVEACLPYLKEQVELVNPRVLVALGVHAARALLGRPVSISRVRGQRLEALGRALVPTYHPAAALRGTGAAEAIGEDLRLARGLLEETRKAVSVLDPPEQLGLF